MSNNQEHKECKDCPDRHLACHDTCKDYLERRKERERVKEIKRKAVELEHSFFEITCKGKKRKR